MLYFIMISLQNSTKRSQS